MGRESRRSGDASGCERRNENSLRSARHPRKTATRSLCDLVRNSSTQRAKTQREPKSLSSRLRSYPRSRLGEKFADQALFFLVFDAREKLCSELRDCLRLVERELVVHLTALKMTGHAT